MRQRALCTAALAAVLAFGGAGAALAAKAPEDPVEKHFKDLEKQIKQLRAIVTQARDSGQPVQVRLVTDPDPTVQALEQRVDDLEGAARTRNAQIDTLTHELDEARKQAADAQDADKALADRLSKLEAAVKAQGEAAAQAASSGAAAAAGDTAAAGPGAPAAPPAGDPDAAFGKARQLLLEGQYAAAGSAFQDFVSAYGDSDHGPEARYWLGETLFIRGMYPDAATAYIGAIRGWPRTSWAPDAVLKLARSLAAMDKAQDACRTLDELDKRYPDAPRSVKTRADAARRQASCGSDDTKASDEKPEKGAARKTAAKTAERASRRR
jgi:tol-pal system protein YbgF